MTNFSDLSGAVFSWLEERCKPQLLQEAMYDVLSEVRGTYQSLDPSLDSQQQQLQQQQHLEQLGRGHPQDMIAQLKQQQQHQQDKRH